MREKEYAMSKINISQPHAISIEAAKEKLKSFEETMGKYGVSANWSGNNATLKGMAVSGGIQVTEAMVEIELKLGMMARAAGVDPDRLKASIEKRLRASFEDQ